MNHSFFAVFLRLCLFAALVAADLGDLATGLKPKLSATAEIFYPGSAGYTEATTRWSASIKPSFKAVVRITSEADIQATVSLNLGLLNIRGNC